MLSETERTALAVQTAEELNKLSDEELFSGIDRALNQSSEASRLSDPIAAFITRGVLLRLHNHVVCHHPSTSTSSGWGKQATLARAVAEFVGEPIPANDGTAEKAGSNLDQCLRRHCKVVRTIKRGGGKPERKQERLHEEECAIAYEAMAFSSAAGSGLHPGSAVTRPIQSTVMLRCTHWLAAS